MGQERLIELMRQHAEPAGEAPHVYLVMAGEGSVSGGLQLAESLRDDLPWLKIQSNLAGGSFKAQFKRADRSGAALALVLGEDELAGRSATLKHLREDLPQESVAFDDLQAWFTNWSASRG
jgi:histidyl-tRNA synthetase